MSNLLSPPISTPPKRLKMSYAEYLNVASETQITEWVDGEIIIHMPPIYEHQYLAGFLQALLLAFILDFDLGELVVAPYEVKLWPDGPSREPDLAFIHHSNQAQLKRKSKRYDGAPDLIIEIVSPSSVRDDRVDKFMEYEQAGVKEYWIIDPRSRRQRVDVYGRNPTSNMLEEMPIDEAGRFHSAVLPGFWLDPDWLWQNVLPDYRSCLATIMLTVPTLPEANRAYYQQTLNLYGHP